MPISAPTLHRQVGRVRRRLFLQTLVRMLIRCWVAALLTGVVWFLTEPFVVRDALPNLRWYVLGGTVAVATSLAVALAAWSRPSPVAAALALDERFQLKERVTTSLMLDSRDADSPAAMALLADVDRRVMPLYVSDRFPIKVPWTAVLVPVCAAILVLLAFFYKPALNNAQAAKPDEDPDQKLVQADEVKNKLENMVKKGAVRKVTDKAKSQEMQNIDKELDKLAHRPFDTKDDIREAQKDLTGVEDAMKKRAKEDADRQEAFKEQMKQVERTNKKEEKKDGPADKLDNAINKAEFDKAQDEAERLSRKLQDQENAKKEEEQAQDDVERLKKKKEEKGLNDDEKKELDQAEERLAKAKKDQLTPEDKQNLEQQLKDEQDKLQRLTRNKEEKEQELKEKKENGEIDQEQLDRELDQLAKQEQDEKNLSDEEKKEREKEKQELKELAQKLGECQKCLKDGNDKGAGEKLGEAAKLIQKLDNKGEQKDLQQKLKELQEVKKELAKAADGKNGKNIGRNHSGPNQGGQGAGLRDEAKDDGKTGHDNIQERSTQDKGENNVIDYVPGQGFKGPRKPSELKEDIRRASQDAPEALDRQRLPRSASDMARGYFDKMRGPEKTPEK